MDWYRDGTRQRSRILYVFRTPGGVRVGRAPLEPEVLRHIESQYPEITFDWKGVLDSRQVVDAAPEPRRPQRRRPEQDASAAAPQTRIEPQPAQRATPSGPAIPAVIDGSTSDERIAFLLHWYPIARERVMQRVADPARREALVGLAERLNPAAWADADQVTSGLQHASEALERLSRVLTRRRRRSGRIRSASPSPPAEVSPTGE